MSFVEDEKTRVIQRGGGSTKYFNSLLMRPDRVFIPQPISSSPPSHSGVPLFISFSFALSSLTHFSGFYRWDSFATAYTAFDCLTSLSPVGFSLAVSYPTARQELQRLGSDGTSKEPGKAADDADLKF